MHPRQTRTAPAPGTVLDQRYRLDALLGEGGHARVWRATQLSTGQAVAIKLLRDGPDGRPVPRRAARFEREMKLVAHLRHPHIVRLIDAALSEETLFAVFELVEGTTLATHLQRHGAMPPADAVRVMLPVLEALAHAHRAGVIHRDLKPDNIMLAGESRRLRVKVVDFGIAGILVGARTQDYESITRSADFVGTPAYMAPEQIGHAKNLTPRIDLYAWGLILAECLCGRRIVDHPSLMEQALAHASEAPHQLPDTIEEPLRGIVARAIAKDPEARFADADDALAALDAAHLASAIAATVDGELDGAATEPMTHAQIAASVAVATDARRRTLDESPHAATVRLELDPLRQLGAENRAAPRSSGAGRHLGPRTGHGPNPTERAARSRTPLVVAALAALLVVAALAALILAQR